MCSCCDESGTNKMQYVAVGTTAAAFVLAFGVKWERITDKRPTDPEEAAAEPK